jgi:hypothetical protein
MQWADLVDGKWRIPSEEREKTNAGNLRLPQLVLDIINAQPRIDGNPHVFPGSTRGRRRLKGKPSGPPAFNSFSQAKAELDAKLPDLPHWTLHDLRRTARSLMSRAGVASDIAERVLGHAIAGVEGVYDQHDYAEEKADALQRLAALVETIINPPEDNVVALGERHRTRKQGGLLVASGGLAQPKRAGDAEAAWRGTNAVPWRVSLTVRKWMALDSTQSGVRWLRGGCPLPRSGLAPTASPNALVGNYPPRQLPPASIWVPTGAHRWALLPPAPFGMANAHRCPPARLARGAGRDSCLRGCGSSTTLPLACR